MKKYFFCILKALEERRKESDTEIGSGSPTLYKRAFTAKNIVEIFTPRNFSMLGIFYETQRFGICVVK